MHAEMIGDLPLTVSMSLYCLLDPLVPPSPMLKGSSPEQILQAWSVQEALLLGYLRYLPVALEIGAEALDEALPSQDALALHSLPDGFLVDTLLYEPSILPLSSLFGVAQLA